MIRSLRVLIADDSDIIRRQLGQLVESVDAADVIASVGTADAVVEVFDREHPDVVVLDIEMPGSGIKALRHVRSESDETVVVMLTNHAGPYYKKLCLREGANFFLDKSREFEQVPELLESIAVS